MSFFLHCPLRHFFPSKRRASETHHLPEMRSHDRSIEPTLGSRIDDVASDSPEVGGGNDTTAIFTACGVPPVLLNIYEYLIHAKIQ